MFTSCWAHTYFSMISVESVSNVDKSPGTSLAALSLPAPNFMLFQEMKVIHLATTLCLKCKSKCWHSNVNAKYGSKRSTLQACNIWMTYAYICHKFLSRQTHCQTALRSMPDHGASLPRKIWPWVCGQTNFSSTSMETLTLNLQTCL